MGKFDCWAEHTTWKLILNEIQNSNFLSLHSLSSSKVFKPWAYFKLPGQRLKIPFTEPHPGQLNQNLRSRSIRASQNPRDAGAHAGPKATLACLLALLRREFSC